MKYLFVVLLTFLIQSGEREVAYGPGQSLALLDGEKLKSTTDRDINFYDPFHSVMNYQVPIHKTIDAEGYKCFFGIGVGFDSDESVLAAAYIHDPSYSIIDTTHLIDLSTGLTTYRYFLKKGDLYNHKYIFTISAPLMTLVVNEISKDSALIANLYFDKEYVLKRRLNEE